MVVTFFPSVRVDPRLTLQRLYLRPPSRKDWAEWAELRSESREFLLPWEPTWPHNALSKTMFRRQLAYHSENWSQGRGYAFLIFRRVDDALVGGLTISNVRRGIAQSCSFGYWIGRQYARQGYMTETVIGACDYVFEQLHLHRIEAACLVNNTASLGVLKKAGFHYEGLVRGYLKINGRWRDHKLFALLREDFRPPQGG